MSRLATVNFQEQVNGDTLLTKEFRFWTSALVTAMDLSDATVKIQIRKDNENGRLYKTATSGDGVTWVNQAEGKFQFGGFDIDWGGAGKYYYDIQMTYGTSGIVRTYVKGIITVLEDVTAT